MTTTRLIHCCLAAAIVLSALGGQGLAEDRLARKRYVDPTNGFSLIPPADAERAREFSPSRLVSWVKRDPKTGAIAWKLTVLRAVESKQDFNIDQYAKALAQKLQASENYNIDSTELSPVAGKPAIHFRGIAGGAVQLWQRQVYVLTKPGIFLVFMIAGSKGMEKELDAIASDVMATVQITDPEEALKIQRANLQRGQDMLTALPEQRLTSAMIAERQWFLLRLKDQNVGFMAQSEAVATEMDARGIQVTTWVMLQPPDDQTRLLKRVMFTTADRVTERWKEQLQYSSDKPDQSPFVRAEDGLIQNDALVCNIDRGTVDVQKKTVPKAIYLPRAMSYMLPRLVDLRKAQAYAFAVYNTDTNDFDMRTFTVAGPDSINYGSSSITTVKLTDQPSLTTDPATLWVDGKGRLLRMLTGDGLQLEATTREGVMQIYPKAQAYIDAMGKWASQK